VKRNAPSSRAANQPMPRGVGARGRERHLEGAPRGQRGTRRTLWQRPPGAGARDLLLSPSGSPDRRTGRASRRATSSSAWPVGPILSRIPAAPSASGELENAAPPAHRRPQRRGTSLQTMSPRPSLLRRGRARRAALPAPTRVQQCGRARSQSACLPGNKQGAFDCRFGLFHCFRHAPRFQCQTRRRRQVAGDHSADRRLGRRRFVECVSDRALHQAAPRGRRGQATETPGGGIGATTNHRRGERG
jgi:hypothetical protein